MRVSARVLFFLAGVWGLAHGTVHIPQCNAETWLEIQEEKPSVPLATCAGLPNNEFTWDLYNTSADTATVTCSKESCTSTTPAANATGFGNMGTSELYIYSKLRELVGNGKIECSAIRSSAECRTNVIKSALLPFCEVMMVGFQTLGGTCNFYAAYSSNGTYTCTWALTMLGNEKDPDVIIPGVIHKTPYTVSGKLYYNGTCSFTRSGLAAGQYMYTARFFPNTVYTGDKPVAVIDFSPSEIVENRSDQILIRVTLTVCTVTCFLFIIIFVGVHLNNWWKNRQKPGQRKSSTPSSGTRENVPTTSGSGTRENVPTTSGSANNPLRPQGPSTSPDATLQTYGATGGASPALEESTSFRDADDTPLVVNQ